MQQIAWLMLMAIVAALAYWGWRLRRGWLERQRAAEARAASFIAQAAPAVKAVPPAPAAALVTPVASAPAKDAALSAQRLLFEAASMAGEAGEPALSIQLYARLLARYPQTALAGQARAALEVQKRRLAKR